MRKQLFILIARPLLIAVMYSELNSFFLSANIGHNCPSEKIFDIFCSVAIMMCSIPATISFVILLYIDVP